LPRPASRIVFSCYDHPANPVYGGGGALVVEQIATRLARDHDVTVLAGSYRGARPPQWRPYRQVFLPTGWAGPRAGQLLFSLLLPFAARRAPHDLWLESFTPPFSVSFLPLFTSRPVIALVQMLTAEETARRYKLPFVGVERRGLRQYWHFVVLNDVDAEIIRRGRPQVCCVRIPNGVKVPDDSRPAGSGDYMLFMGRIDVEQKGLDLLLEALAIAQPTLPLVMAGTGIPGEERRLRRLLAQSAGPVTRVGHVSGAQKHQVLSDAAFVVMPSRYETFGISALEAMAYGKPVVHFDLPRLSWIEPGTALAVPAYDVNALARALSELSHDADRRAALGRAGRVFAEGISWDVVTERYARLVDDHLDLVAQAQRDPGPRRISTRRRSHRVQGMLHKQGATGEANDPST
jgi:glycosyltransferase involved in cell wall biosynthesis